MTTPLERNIEKRFCDQAKRQGCLVYKFVSPNQRGVPDRLVVLPGGETVYIEFKRPNGKLTELQEVQIGRLQEQGARVFVVYSHEDATTVLNELLRHVR